MLHEIVKSTPWGTNRLPLVIAFDIETTGLDPYRNRVVLIGMKQGGETKLFKLWETKKEPEIILSAIRALQTVRETIVGFNNLKFDVPFMLERLRILGRWENRFWGINYMSWFDLYQYLGNDFRGLNYWLGKAGIKKQSEILGRDIPRLYRMREYAKIESHNLDDLNTSELLFLYLKKNNPEVLRFA